MLLVLREGRERLPHRHRCRSAGQRELSISHLIPGGIQHMDIQIRAKGADRRRRKGHRQLHSRMRRSGGSQFLGRLYFAVHRHRQPQRIGGQIGEIAQVRHPQSLTLQRRLHGLVGIFRIVAARLKAAVIEGQTVAAEVAVVDRLAEVAAVPGHAVHQHRMVGPLPDAAADGIGKLMEQLYIAVDIAGAVAHGVGIFAQEHRTGGVVLAQVGEFLQRVIHPAAHIHQQGIALMIRLLIVGQAGGIPLLRPPEHDLKVAAVAALVAHAPEDHRGVVFIPLHRAPDAVHIGFLPGRIVGDHGGGGAAVRNVSALPGDKAVGLQICLVHHIEAHLVAKVEEFRGGRIMRGADAVDIQLLHFLKLRAQHLLALHIALGGMGIVMVHALEDHRHAVDQQLTAGGYGYLPQPHPIGDILRLAPYHHGVEIGMLRIPQNGVGQIRHLSGGIVYGIVRRRHGDALAVGVNFHILNGVLLPGQQIDVPENAVEPEKVLVLQIAAGAPFQHLGHQLVFALMHIRGQIKLRLQMAPLGEAHILPVHIQIQAGGRPLKHDVGVPRRPAAVQREAGTVDAAGVLIRHIGRVHRVGVVQIRIVGKIIPVHLPAGGHRLGVVEHRVRRIFRHIQLPRKIGKIPNAVEQPIIGALVAVKRQRLFRRLIGNGVSLLGQSVIANPVCPLVFSHSSSPFFFSVFTGQTQPFDAIPPTAP